MSVVPFIVHEEQETTQGTNTMLDLTWSSGVLLVMDINTIQRSLPDGYHDLSKA